jgi:hypothetical protein
MDLDERRFHGGERCTHRPYGGAEKVRDLAGGVRIAGIDHGDVDRPRQRVASYGYGLEPLAQPRRESERELPQRRDAHEDRSSAALVVRIEELFEARRVDRVGPEEAPRQTRTLRRRED